MWCTPMFVVLFLLNFNIASTKCEGQIGPDPWDYASNVNTMKQDEIPLDLRNVPTKKVQTNNIGTGEWFYKRILAIILKGGQIKKNEDGSIDVSLQMRYSPKQWNILDEYIASNTAMSEDIFRRSIGYVEEAIYRPTITEKIVMAWTEYIQAYLIEYKVYIVWITSILAVIGSAVWLMHRISHKHVIILLFVGFYMYEVFVSYKEAEKQELDRFVTAMNTCKWFIWSSTCEVPSPDPVIFLKHMNPLKIGVKMFSTVLSEPVITISETVKTISHGITDGLWFPIDKIVYGILMVTFNAMIICLLVMAIFNFILNIPFNLSFLGLLSIGLKQRKTLAPRTFCDNTSENVLTHRKESTDKISGETLTRLLDIFSKALTTTQSATVVSINNGTSRTSLAIKDKPAKMSRSASTSRLPNLVH